MSNYAINYDIFISQIRGAVVKKEDTTAYLLLVLACSLIYGGVLAALPLDEFRDRDNYLRYATISWDILETYWAKSPLVALANEPLWLLINAGLAKIFAPETILRLIIFFPATWVAWNVLRQDSRQFIWLLLFLLIPQIFVHHLCMLRQGLAIAIFLAGWFSHRKSVRLLLMAVTPFIHASFFFVLLLLMVVTIARRLRLAAGLRILLFAGLGLGVALLLGWVVPLLGARQANVYEFSMTNVSGLGFVFWGMMLAIMCLQGRIFMRRYAFEIGTIVFYLACYFLIEVAARIFESSFLLVLLAGLHLTSWRRDAFLTSIFGYSLLQYALRLNEPWLGFGIT